MQYLVFSRVSDVTEDNRRASYLEILVWSYNAHDILDTYVLVCSFVHLRRYTSSDQPAQRSAATLLSSSQLSGRPYAVGGVLGGHPGEMAYRPSWQSRQDHHQNVSPRHQGRERGICTLGGMHLMHKQSNICRLCPTYRGPGGK
jgi:hypothetical protein